MVRNETQYRGDSGSGWMGGCAMLRLRQRMAWRKRKKAHQAFQRSTHGKHYILGIQNVNHYKKESKELTESIYLHCK